MKIVIKSLPHREQRYPTAGDYWRDTAGNLQIRVSEMSDPRSMLLVAIHELVEVLLCEERGISEAEIMEWDTQAGANFAEPGESPMAPYHDEHVFAENIERQMARELGVNWQEHEAVLDALFGD